MERQQVDVEATGTPATRTGEWVVTLDLEDPSFAARSGTELAVRALAVAVAGSRAYVAARPSGYSFTAIIGTTSADNLMPALVQALDLLSAAQQRAGLPEGVVVCAEVTLVGSRPVPAAEL
jgi:hypothetical protein